MLLNLPLSISSLIFAISPWAARKCRDGSEKENEELKNVQEVHVYIPSVLCYNSLVTFWSVVNVRGEFYCNIAFLWPWNSKIGKINIWASLKVGSCLACGSCLTHAYVWLVKWPNSFGTGDIPQVRTQVTVLQMKNRIIFRLLIEAQRSEIFFLRRPGPLFISKGLDDHPSPRHFSQGLDQAPQNMLSSKPLSIHNRAVSPQRLQIFGIDREGMIDDVISQGIWCHLCKKYSLTWSSQIYDVSHCCAIAMA